MGEIVEIGGGENSDSQNLGDFLAEMAVSDDDDPIDSVEAVREIREYD